MDRDPLIFNVLINHLRNFNCFVLDSDSGFREIRKILRMGVNLYCAATHAPCSVERFVSPFNERQLRDINPSFEIGNHRIEGFTSASQMFNLTIVPCVGIDSRLTTFAACIMVTQKNMAFPSPKNFEYGGKGQASGFHYYFGHYTNIFITSYGQSQITAIFQWDTSI